MKINYWQTFESGQVYHIYNRAVSDRNLFDQEEHYNRFLKIYSKYFNSCFDTLAYCLMPNHFHFLVKVKSIPEIIKNVKFPDSEVLRLFTNNKATVDSVVTDYMRRLFSSHAIYINNRSKVRGPLFQKSFKRVAIDKEYKLKYIVAYIHHNPIHHGFRDQYTGWSYSSYSDYINEKDSLVEKEFVLQEFDGLSSFKEYHQTFKTDYKELLNLDKN